MAVQRVRGGAIEVHGLAELNKALRDMEPVVKKGLTATNKGVAETEAKSAQSAAHSLGGVAAKVAPSVKASATRTAAGVGFGGPAYPMAGGAEFGGQRRPTTKQFKPWRGNGANAGYFVYPTIRQDAEKIKATYATDMDTFLKEIGLL